MREGNLLSFSLLSGQASELQATLFASLPAEFCHGLFPTNGLCLPLEPLPGGEYGEQLNGLLRQFEPQFAAAAGTLAFPLSLDQAELLSLVEQMAPQASSLAEKLNADLAELDPSPEFREDHKRVAAHFEKLDALMDEVSGAALAGDQGPARGIETAITAIFCETTGGFSSEEFETLVAAHFGQGPPPHPSMRVARSSSTRCRLRTPGRPP